MNGLSKLLRLSGICIFLVVVMVGPYFKGLFFWTELLAGIAVVAIGSALWVLGRRLGNLPTGFPGGLAGWALAGLSIYYVLLFPWAVYVRGNVDICLRLFSVWLAYVAVRAETGSNLRRFICWAIVLGSASIALVGLLEFTGYFELNRDVTSALALIGAQDRLFTVFQYHNTAAAVFMTAMMVATGLGLDGRATTWRMTVAGALSGLIATAFFFTLSRGAMVILPIGMLLLLAGFERSRLWQGVLTLGGFILVPLVVSVNGVARYVPSHNWGAAMEWACLGVVGGAISGLALSILFRFKGRVQAGIVAGVIGIAVAAFLTVHAGGPMIPKLANRLLDVNFRTPNLVLRLIFDQDAARIVADRPLGYGGWGWERTYRRYQAFNYFVRETHDHYAQTAVEAGLPGVLLLLTALFTSLWTAFRNRKNHPLRWAMAAGSSLIAIHAAIDFDLSFYPVLLMVWILLAASASDAAAEAGLPTEMTSAAPDTVNELNLAGRTFSIRNVAPRLSWITPLMCALFVAAVSGWLFLGSRHLDRAETLLEHKDEYHAKIEAKAAHHYDPLDSRPLQIIGGITNLQAAVNFDQQNPELWRDLAVALNLKGDYDGAIAAARVALENQPAVTDYYELYCRLAGFRLDQALADRDMTKARTLASDLTQVGKQLADRMVTTEPLQRQWGLPPLQWTNIIYLHVAKGLYLTGDQKNAETYFKLAARQWQFASEADVYLYAMYEKQGRGGDMKALENKPWLRFRDLNRTYQTLRTWDPRGK